MVVIRPIRLDDLPALVDLVKDTGFGLTTLPRDEQVLRRRIEKSLAGFKADPSVQPRTYLFAMEDIGFTPSPGTPGEGRGGGTAGVGELPPPLPSPGVPGEGTKTESTGATINKLAGVCGIISQVGGAEPFYTYRIDKTVHQSQQLGVRKEIATLNLSVRNDGPSEIGSLFLSPEYRHGGNGRLLSLSRFLFMADHLQYFEPMVIAEMRGVVDANGRSAFWDAVGRHFFEVDFPTADHMSMVSKQFIYDLMPRHPIYIPLLPYEAQKVLGQVHPDTQPALKMLQSEGFTDAGMRDLFEGGPTIECRIKDIRAVCQSMKLPVGEITAIAATSRVADARPVGSRLSEDRANVEMIITNTRHADFRACKANIEIHDGKARIESSVAAALQVKAGDYVRFVPCVPAKSSKGNCS